MLRRFMRAHPVLMAVFWSLAALLVLVPALAAWIAFDPFWWHNVAAWLILGPGILGALALGPAWYYRRRKLLQREATDVPPASGRRWRTPG